MMPRPFLSICVPTFNRLAKLKDNLGTLLPQAESLGFEVCVSDNASSDGTIKYLESLCSKFTCLRIQGNDKNIGLDRNMISVIRMASGQYVYPMGDDDVVPTGNLHLVAAALHQPVDLLVMNAWHTDATLTPLFQHLNPNTAGCSFVSAAKAFERIWDKMDFGSFLASRECFFDTWSDRYIGTGHAYSGLVWDGLAAIERRAGSIQVVCTEQPLVLIRGAEKTWKSEAGAIILCGVPRWLTLISHEEIYMCAAESVKSLYLEVHTGYCELIKFHASQQLSWQVRSDMSKDLNARQKLRLFLVGLLPQRLLSMALRAARSLKSRSHNVNLQATR